MLIGYFDDSGKESDPSNRLVCMAGYLAVDDYWEQFGPQWYHHLLKHGVSCFHMKELIPRQGEFKDLTLEKRDELLLDCVKVIKENELIGFGVGVDAEAWRLLPDALTKSSGNAQEFCFLRIIRLIIERLKRVSPNEKLALIFDCDQEFAARRFKQFSKLRERPEIREHLASIAFCDPRLYIPLQAADFLAWETRKELIQKALGFDSTERFKELFVNVPGLRLEYAGEQWNETALKERVLQPWEAAQTESARGTPSGQ